MASRTASRRRSPKAPARPSRRGGSSGKGTGPGPLVWIGASVAAWLVWNLTQPKTASAAEPGLPVNHPGALGSTPGAPAPGSRLPAGSGSSLPPSGQQPTANSQQASSTLLRRGSTGPAVLAWQTSLVYGGYLPDAPSSRDSSFGPLTEAATRVFQQKAGIAVDGIVGPETRAAAQRMMSTPSP